MRSRLTKFAVAIASLAALAVGGSALASAAHKGPPPAPTKSTPLQQDEPATPETQTDPAESGGEVPSESVDADNVQQGDQSGNDQVDAQDEQPGTSSNDGPGGYADSNPNADTEQQGEH